MSDGQHIATLLALAASLAGGPARADSLRLRGELPFSRPELDAALRLRVAGGDPCGGAVLEVSQDGPGRVELRCAHRRRVLACGSARGGDAARLVALAAVALGLEVAADRPAERSPVAVKTGARREVDFAVVTVAQVPLSTEVEEPGQWMGGIAVEAATALGGRLAGFAGAGLHTSIPGTTRTKLQDVNELAARAGVAVRAAGLEGRVGVRGGRYSTRARLEDDPNVSGWSLAVGAAAGWGPAGATGLVVTAGVDCHLLRSEQASNRRLPATILAQGPRLAAWLAVGIGW